MTGKTSLPLRYTMCLLYGHSLLLLIKFNNRIKLFSAQHAFFRKLINQLLYHFLVFVQDQRCLFSRFFLNFLDFSVHNFGICRSLHLIILVVQIDLVFPKPTGHTIFGYHFKRNFRCFLQVTLSPCIIFRLHKKLFSNSASQQICNQIRKIRFILILPVVKIRDL